MYRKRRTFPFIVCLWRTIAALCLLGGMVVAGAADEPATIIDIRFVGNKTTQPQIMLQEMVVRVGDPVNAELIERSRQAIMDLGLFKSVRADLLPEPEGQVLRISVKEKYYILPIPKMNRNDENEIGFGAQLRLDNIAGLNQQLKLTYEQEKTSESSSGEQDVFSLLYVYPRMWGGPYRLEVTAGAERLPIATLTNDVVTANYDKTASFAAFRVTRWLDLKGPSQGWQVGGGLMWHQNTYTYQLGTPDLYQDGTAVGALGLIEYHEVHDYLYSRSGQSYGVSIEYGLPSLGSDSGYDRELFYYRGYYRVFDWTHHNLDVQLQLGLSSGQLSGEDAYKIGGSSSLRGYESGSLTGNAFVLANVEYQAPLFGYYPLRGVLFADAGNTFPSNSDISLSDLKWSAGVGLRLVLKSFVRLNLRVDAAYAADTGETKVYATSKQMF